MSETTKIKIGFERDPTGTRAIQNDLSALNALAERLAKNFERIAKSISSISSGGKQGFSSFERIPNQSLKGQGALLNGIFGSGDYGAAQRSSNNVIKALDAVTKKVEETERKTSSAGRKIRNNLSFSVGSVGGWGGNGYTAGDGWAQYTATPTGAISFGTAPNVQDNTPGPGGFRPAKPVKTPKYEPTWRDAAAGSMLGAGFGSLFGGQGGVIGGILGAAGGTSGPMAGITRGMAPYMGGIAVGAGIAALANKGAEAFEDLRAKQVGFTLSQPFTKLGVAANVAGFHSNIYNRGVGGDIAYLGAVGKTLNDRALMGALGNTVLNKESLMLRFAESPLSLSSAGKRVKDFLGSAAANTFSGAAEGITGLKLSPVEQQSALEMLRTEGYQAMGAEHKAKFEQAVQNNLTFDPQMNRLKNEIFSGAMGKTRILRMAGISSGTFSGMNIAKVSPADFEAATKGLPARTRLQAMRRLADEHNAIPSNRVYNDLVREANLIGQGRDESDIAAAKQQILGIGSGFGRHIRGINDLLSPGEAGLTNAAQLVRAGGILGGSASYGGHFLNKVVQGSIGANGLDVAVGRDLFGGLSSDYISQGNFGTGLASEAAMRGAASVVAGGVGAPLDVGAQLRNFQQLQLGRQNINAFTQGTKAPLYKATGLLGAISAMGGYGSGASALSQLSGDVISGIMRSGEVPSYLAEQGVGIENVRAYGMYQRKSPFFELRDDFIGGNAGALVKQMRASGDIIAFAKSKTAGLSGSNRAAVLQSIAGTLGGAMFSLNLAPSQDAGAGSILDIFSQDKDLYGDLAGGGVHSPGPKGLTKAALLAEKQRLLDDAAAMGRRGDETEADYNNRINILKNNVYQARQAEKLKDVGDLDTVATSFVHSAEALANAIRQAVKGLNSPVQAKAR